MGSPALSRVALSLPAVVALVIWRLSLRHVDIANLGSYGLPPALPITWYLALSLSVVGAVTAITVRRTSGLIMVVYLVAIAIILYGTVPVLSVQPHYSWVYKHIGVVLYLEAHGKVNPSIDIYNRWPGFFALGAAFSTVAGRPNPETYASWAELFFPLLDALLVMAAVKAITREVRIAAGAALLFTVTNWVGQSYYAAQAFAFALSLALIAVMLRQLRVDGPCYSKRLTRWIERVGRVPQLSVQTDTTAKWPRSAAIAIVLSLDAVIVASHQLTPYMLLVSIVLLMLAGVVRPWWMLIVMAIITFSYFAANFDYIQHNYSIFTSIDPFTNAQRGTAYGHAPEAGKAFNQYAARAATVTLWFGALCASLRLFRRGLLVRALPLLLLAGSPFAVVFGQNYGGEASLRIVLFSSPWCSALIAWAFATIGRPGVRRALMLVGVGVCTALFVPAFLGQEELNIVSAGEVRASAFFYRYARQPAILLLPSFDFPLRYGASYPAFIGPEDETVSPPLLNSSHFQNRQLGASNIPEIISIIKQNAPYGYIAFARTQTVYAQVFRLTPPGALDHLEAAVARSPDFRLWYGNKDAQIYELAETHVARQLSAHKLQNPSIAPPSPALRTLPLVQPLASFGRYPFYSQHRYARNPKKSHLVRTIADLDARHRGRVARRGFSSNRGN
jgi:hypothetical protein